MPAHSEQILLCIYAVSIGYLLNTTYLNIATSVYFTLYSPTYRWTDLSSPCIALMVSSRIMPFIIASNDPLKYYVFALITYIFCYFISMSVLTVILPRYTLNKMGQPKDKIIKATENTKYGFTTHLEKDSPSDALMTKLKQMGDDEADKLWPDLLKLLNSKKYANMDAVDVLLDNVDTNPKFSTFVKHLSTVPAWFDFNKFKKAQKLHQRYAILFGYVLAICTLVGGFGCPEINKVLISSRYWANHNDMKSLKNTLNRLRETSVWLFTVMWDTDSLKPFGSGWKSILRVRLFHCKIRYQLSLSKSHESKAINQCHLIGTLLGFQYNPLIVLHHVVGLPISDKDRDDYTHLWRYIGWVLGIVDDEKIGCVPLKNFDVSRAWMAKIWQNLIHPDIESGINSTTLMLSSHVLKAIALNLSSRSVGKAFSLGEQTIGAAFRAFLTEEYANMISLATIHWSYELQIRVIICIARIWHIAMYLFGINWLNTMFWSRGYYAVMKHITGEILAKKEKYQCRFTKYCPFNQ